MTPERWQRIKALFGAALERRGEERSAFVLRECAGDESMARELQSLLSAHGATQPSFLDLVEDRSGEVGTEPTRDDGPSPAARIGPYRILRELGHGGMGTVFLAERDDAEFHKEVALKIIRRGMDSEAVVAHFRNERQLLAELSHPNIATLLDGGTTPDGSPYFVMEYVPGEPIDHYCDARVISVQQRLVLFLAVCDAVQQAHAKLIVHRDIKAANILVTSGGIPKLLDFGVAKLLDQGTRASDRTETQGRFFTPAFASPEQFRRGLISTTTDVYQLGALLYVLLTGLKPFETEGHSTEEIERAVCGEEPAKPSRAAAARQGADAAALSANRGATPDKLRRLLGGDLDTIVMKAMEKEPSRRYGSVEALANDIRRHLAGLPITARPGSVWYRASRFVGRHRLGVSAAALVIVALSGSVLEIARQRIRAERRFNDVRKLANSFLFEFHDAIKGLPGSTAARALVVKKGLEYLDGLAQETGSDRALQGELADAYERMANVQGGDRTANLGSTEAALDSYRKALAIREALVASNPRDRGLRSALAGAYRGIAYLRLIAGDPAGGAELAKQALALDEKLAAEAPPGDRQAREHVADSTSLRGYLLGASGNAEGLAMARKALGMLEALAAESPEDASIRVKLAATYDRLGDLLDVTGDYREAHAMYGKATAIEEARAAAEASNPSLRFRVAGLYSALGDVEVKLGERESALSHYRRCFAIIEALSRADPASGHYRQSLGAAYQRVGDMEVEAGQIAAGLANLRQSVSILEAALAADPASAIRRGNMAGAAEGMGKAFEKLARSNPSAAAGARHWREARSWYQRSRDLWLELRKQGATTGEEAAMPEKLERAIATCDMALVNPGAG